MKFYVGWRSDSGVTERKRGRAKTKRREKLEAGGNEKEKENEGDRQRLQTEREKRRRTKKNEREAQRGFQRRTRGAVASPGHIETVGVFPREDSIRLTFI